MNDFADGIFKAVTTAKEPRSRVAILTDKELEILLDGLAAELSPNEFHASVFAMAMLEVFARFKKRITE